MFSGGGLSASYTALLTWLLSLVPQDFTSLQGDPTPRGQSPATPGQPFHVVGLQQGLLDGQLSLMVAVVPSPHFQPHHKHSKNKKNKVTCLAKDDLISNFFRNTVTYFK